MDWFLYDNGLRHERVKGATKVHFKHYLGVAIIFIVNTDLSQSAFSSYYFGKQVLHLSLFFVCSEIWIWSHIIYGIIRNNLLGNFHKPQNLSYKESNKTFSSLEKVSISHDNDTSMEPRETVKKQSTNRQ